MVSRIQGEVRSALLVDTETVNELVNGPGRPRDDLRWCRVVTYTHVVILSLSLLATRLDGGLFKLSFETKQGILQLLLPPMLYGLYISPIVTIVVLSRLKHSSSAYCLGIFLLEVVLCFVQMLLMLPLVQ